MDPDFYTNCQVCLREQVPVYPAQGNRIDSNGVPDRDASVYAACAACLNAGRVRHIDETYLNAFISKFASDPPAAIALLRRTPRCPMSVQDTDWPFCCGAATEYIGVPTVEEAAELDRTGKYWEFGPAEMNGNLADLGPLDELDIIGGFAEFQCHACHQKYWTFQST
jgi:hypothetical protein